jgi:ESF2/ABP1 family protein
MDKRRNEYLDGGSSDSDEGEGYDSEAAEYSKTSIKRRKLYPSETGVAARLSASDSKEESVFAQKAEDTNLSRDLSLSLKDPEPSTKITKTSKPGVIYLSSLPPYLKPSALRNLLTHRGFSPISRLFLAPSSKSKNQHSKKNSRQLYSEGWIEFASRKIAKRCAETLNAATVGGRKGGFYHDDMWNMKYLRGVSWDDLMAQVREERREEEVRRMEERTQIARETKDFVEGVERGKMERGMEKSRERKKTREKDGGEVSGGQSGNRRTWRQYKAMVGESGPGPTAADAVLNDDVKGILSKIF